MEPAFDVPQINTPRASASTLDVDLVVVPAFQDGASGLEPLDDGVQAEARAAVERGEFTGKPHELLTLPPAGWRAPRALLVGQGPRADFTAERARRSGAAIAIAARQQRRGRVAIVFSGAWAEALVESLIEGLVLGNYDNGQYKSAHGGRFFVSSVDLVGQGELARAAERGRRLGEAANHARVLINEPGNRLTPRDFVERGRDLLDIPGVTTEILDEHRIAELNMGLLLGVARGSAEPPRMLVARYEPAKAAPQPVLGLIGKGVTFDTGGISIKPADGMERMKDDMAGGATVIAALRTIALEQLPVRTIVVVPATENMPGGRATKPGDIHRGASGLTVEINNTDAEGRLILGDALWYARQLGATHLIDVATLTGACIVALGKTTTGLWGTPGWGEVVRAAAERGGEKVWPMPLFEEYREALKSEIADMINSPGRAAGAVTAAMFLKEFAGDAPWAHLDIAGTAWAEDARPWTVKGATGVMTRTLVEVARSAGRDWPAAAR